MTLQSTSASLVIVVGQPDALPRLYWRGVELTEVVGIKYAVDSDEQWLSLKVARTSTFDDQYAEMQAAGITIKKRRVL